MFCCLPEGVFRPAASHTLTMHSLQGKTKHSVKKGTAVLQKRRMLKKGRVENHKILIEFKVYFSTASNCNITHSINFIFSLLRNYIYKHAKILLLIDIAKTYF